MRFPEFSEEWMETKLKDVGEYYGGGTPDTSVKDYWKGTIAWISSSDIKENTIHAIDKSRYITKEAIEQSATKLIPKGSILMVSRVGIGKFAIADEELCTSQDFTNLVTKENEYFLGNYFKARSNRFVRLSQGTSIKGFTINDIKMAKFLIPSLPEQTKIASFLTTVDKRISTQNKIIKHQESLMKGLMKQIFSQKLRFKNENGTYFTDWETKKLGEIGNTYNGLTGKTKIDFGKGKPYIQYMQIFSNPKIDVSNFGLVNIEEGENQKSAQYGDVFFTTSSETPNEIGTSSVLTERVEEVYLNSFCFGYRPNSLDNLVPEFSKFFFRSEEVRKEIVKLAQGSTRFNMSKIELMKLQFDIPQKEEQIKIANFLSSLDNRIEEEKQVLVQYQQQKKYLLQNLFI